MKSKKISLLEAIENLEKEVKHLNADLLEVKIWINSFVQLNK